jgi:hypothetical protein
MSKFLPLCIMLFAASMSVSAQIYTVIHDFGSVAGHTGRPRAPGTIAQSRGGAMLTTTSSEAFRMWTGGFLQVLHQFGDGGPWSGLILATDGKFYGTTRTNGTFRAGTVFKMSTRKGIAKGMWQFIPETAVKYGLRIGPLADLRRPDPGDERHQYQKATKAAARYLKDLYTTDAQASGILVMACYNWGENQVLPLVRSMPANPRERNFWRLLAQHRDKIPRETYDYVFYILSAAVIGENPRLFGFDFDNPLAALENREARVERSGDGSIGPILILQAPTRTPDGLTHP